MVVPIYMHLICSEPFVPLFVSLIIIFPLLVVALYLSLQVYFLFVAFCKRFVLHFLLLRRFCCWRTRFFLVPLSIFFFNQLEFLAFSMKLASHQSEFSFLFGYACLSFHRCVPFVLLYTTLNELRLLLFKLHTWKSGTLHKVVYIYLYIHFFKWICHIAACYTIVRLQLTSCTVSMYKCLYVAHKKGRTDRVWEMKNFALFRVLCLSLLMQFTCSKKSSYYFLTQHITSNSCIHSLTIGRLHICNVCIYTHVYIHNNQVGAVRERVALPLFSNWIKRRFSNFIREVATKHSKRMYLHKCIQGCL